MSSHYGALCMMPADSGTSTGSQDLCPFKSRRVATDGSLQHTKAQQIVRRLYTAQGVMSQLEYNRLHGRRHRMPKYTLNNVPSVRYCERRNWSGSFADINSICLKFRYKSAKRALHGLNAHFSSQAKEPWFWKLVVVVRRSDVG